MESLDELTDRAGLEKIKTVGDAYMVVGGAAKLSNKVGPPHPTSN